MSTLNSQHVGDSKSTANGSDFVNGNVLLEVYQTLNSTDWRKDNRNQAPADLPLLTLEGNLGQQIGIVPPIVPTNETSGARKSDADRRPESPGPNDQQALLSAITKPLPSDQNPPPSGTERPVPSLTDILRPSDKNQEGNNQPRTVPENTELIKSLQTLISSLADAAKLRVKDGGDDTPKINLEKRVAQDIIKTGDIAMLSKLVAMSGSAEMIPAINEQLKALGSKMTVSADVGQTLVSGENAGSYKKIDLFLKDGTGKGIASSSPVDEWKSRNDNERSVKKN